MAFTRESQNFFAPQMRGHSIIEAQNTQVSFASRSARIFVRQPSLCDKAPDGQDTHTSLSGALSFILIYEQNATFSSIEYEE